MARNTALMPGAEAFAFPGVGDVGVLLVHGFTGSPAEMRPLGEALAERGIGSEAMLLRGHGTHPDDMLDARPEDWIDDVERGLTGLLERFARAVVIGLSMGGTLTLNIGARHASDPRLAGLVTISAPLVLDDPRLRFARPLSRFIKWQAWGPPDILDQGAWHRHVGYRRFRTRAILDLMAVIDDTNGRLTSVRQPILIVQANADNVVPPRNAGLIHDGVSSPDRRVLMLDDCYHVITVDFAAARLNEAVVDFVERLSRLADQHPLAPLGDPV
jgi:carboxylesterase